MLESATSVSPPKSRSKQLPILGGDHKSFDLFWAVYPRKVAKKKAIQAWIKLAPDPSLIDLIVTDVEQRISSAEWRKENGQFIPHPATYLNGERWKDQPTKLNGHAPPTPVIGPDFFPRNPTDWKLLAPYIERDETGRVWWIGDPTIAPKRSFVPYLGRLVSPFSLHPHDPDYDRLTRLVT